MQTVQERQRVGRQAAPSGVPSGRRRVALIAAGLGLIAAIAAVALTAGDSGSVAGARNDVLRIHHQETYTATADSMDVDALQRHHDDAYTVTSAPAAPRADVDEAFEAFQRLKNGQ